MAHAETSLFSPNTLAAPLESIAGWACEASKNYFCWADFGYAVPRALYRRHKPVRKLALLGLPQTHLIQSCATQQAIGIGQGFDNLEVVVSVCNQ